MSDILLNLEEFVRVATPEGQALDTRRILELLRFRHPSPEWATFIELPTSTGFAGSGTRLDFFAMNTWPSKGHVSIAYEVKVSRNDFANELRKPHKRKDAEELAHECYFVVPHNLVKPDEVPEGWGLIYANRGGLRRVKMATQRTPAPWPMHFIAALARRSADEPPVLTEAMWKVQGQEVGEEELLALAKEKWGREIQGQREAGERSILNSEEYRTLKNLCDVVAHAIGKTVWNCTVDDFREWHEKVTQGVGGAQIDLDEVQLLKDIRSAAEQLLEVRGYGRRKW